MKSNEITKQVKKNQNKPKNEQKFKNTTLEKTRAIPESYAEIQYP